MTGNGTGEQTETVRTLRSGPAGHASDLPTRDLLRGIVSDAGELIRAEIQLAKAELRANLHASVTMAKGMVAAAVLALIGVTLLLVTVIFALANVLPGWAAALIVSGVVLAAAGISFGVAWAKRIRQPLARTRDQLKEDVRWAKERLT
jgi:uncharacterized membrane protein YqjE